ncbi:MAG: TetR/AcrR family transcriptional regulator [Clostridiales bacterium]|nr:TetR/AcrR family transcriptional regulator [Clostridiales bacterium]
MPKIIENLRADILEESMRIIESDGIDGLSIRRLSANLGIAPSTIYNYYQGKEQIIGVLTKVRWEKALKKIDEGYCESNDAVEALSMIVEEMRSSVKSLVLFHISSVRELHSSTSCAEDHKKIIFKQLQERVKKILENQRNSYEDINFASATITKLIVMCMHDSQLKFEDLADAIKKL